MAVSRRHGAGAGPGAPLPQAALGRGSRAGTDVRDAAALWLRLQQRKTSAPELGARHRRPARERSAGNLRRARRHFIRGAVSSAVQIVNRAATRVARKHLAACGRAGAKRYHDRRRRTAPRNRLLQSDHSAEPSPPCRHRRSRSRPLRTVHRLRHDFAVRLRRRAGVVAAHDGRGAQMADARAVQRDLRAVRVPARRQHPQFLGHFRLALSRRRRRAWSRSPA